MGNKTKTIGIIFSTLALVLMSGALLVKLLAPANKKDNTAVAGSADARIRSGLDNASMQTNAATTSPSNGLPTGYLGTGLASTTLTFTSDDLTNINVLMTWISTGTVRSFVQITRQSSDNNIDFYDYGDLLPASNAAASTSPIITWQPNTLNGTSTISKVLSIAPARWTRLIFKLGTSTGVTVNDTIGFHANVMGKVPSGGGQ